MTGARGVAAGVAALACAAALAQLSDSPERRAVEQKEALVRRLVFDSPAESRIAASGSGEARAELDRARALHSKALALARSGDLAGARADLDAAMGAIGRARSLAPDPASRVVDRRARLAGLERSVEALARSYEGHAARLAGTDAGAAAQARLAGAREGLEQARGYAATQHLELAVKAIERTERDLMVGISALLGSTTVRYSQRHGTPGEEYEHEMERNRSYRELVPVAIAELKPRREAAGLIDRFVAANARSLEAAREHAAAGRLGEAIDAIRTGTNSLQSALAAAGLAVPRDMGAD